MRRFAEVMTLVAGVIACTAPGVLGQETPEPGWIEVSGTGTVDVRPDRARLSVTVDSRAEDAVDAAQSNADAMQAVLDALRGAALPGLEVETFGYSLRPEYSRGNDARARDIIAYAAMNSVRVTVTDVGTAGRVIDVATGAGANRVSGISFFASDTEEARSEAMARAVRDATAEATVIAATLGYELGPPLEVNGGARQPGRAITFDARAMPPPPEATPIEVGEQTVTASVSIRFALGARTGG